MMRSSIAAYVCHMDGDLGQRGEREREAEELASAFESGAVEVDGRSEGRVRGIRHGCLKGTAGQ